MENQQNVQLLKEKLKEKSRQLKKVEVDTSNKDERVQHVLSLAEEKINSLKDTIKTQEEEIRASRHSAENDSKGEVGDLKVSDQDSSKLLKEVEQLRSKNKELTKQFDSEKKDRKKLSKEKKLLIDEYKKLKDTKEGKLAKLKEKLSSFKEKKGSNEDPKEIKNLRKKMKTLESQISESEERSKKLADEKDELIASYEKMLNSEGAEEGEKTGLPAEGIAELKKELEQIIAEKEKLEKELMSEREEKEKLSKDSGKENSKSKKQSQVIVKKEEEEGGDTGAPAWMCTFADMVTLLMVFFVLMFSVTTDNTAKFLSIIEGTEDKSVAMGVLEALDEVKIKQSLAELTGLGPGKGQFEFQVEAELKKDIEKAKIEGADVGRNGKKVFVNIPARNLFKPGKADLTKQAIPVLGKLATTFAKLTEYQINIAGHTDDSPISTARFPSNWELSSSRATAVLRFFADKGIDPLQMTATGRSDLFPLFSNTTDLGRSKNRRVEFVLEKEKK